MISSTARAPRGAARAARSQLANQVLVAAVALAGALLLLRVLFLALVLPELVWSGAALIRL
ncbi:MAG: hypothetical protein IT337_14740, partial [Thermomicrobiales bacterium]|nr:hypothetical protein [Thermomicrobiales bacterium]